jgi:hypothetical protein
MCSSDPLKSSGRGHTMLRRVTILNPALLQSNALAIHSFRVNAQTLLIVKCANNTYSKKTEA